MSKTKRNFSILVDSDMKALAEFMSLPLAKNILDEINNFEGPNVMKSESLSNEWRNRAKEYYTSSQKHSSEVHQVSWDCITKALATAPLNSIQYILALDARSKILLHMGMAQACERDIDRALEELKGRSEFRVFQCDLLLRKMECWVQLKFYIPGLLTKRLLCLLLEFSNSQQQENERIYAKLRELNSRTLVRDVVKDRVDEGQRIRIIMPRYHRRCNLSSSKAIEIKYFPVLDYGFSAVATRNLNPGDIISVEPLFATMVERKHDLMICNHCMALSWTPVPCYECEMLFCGEKCRDNALKKYHYLECVLLRNELSMENGDEDCFPVYAKLGLRMLIMARIESRSNEKLFNRIRKFDGGEAPLNSLKRIKQFETFYMFGMNYKVNLNTLIHALMALVTVAKHCALFKDSFYEFYSIEDLLNDKEALELGALILRFILISQRYSQFIFEPHINLYLDVEGRMNSMAYARGCRGLAMSYIAGYFNHSCFPNVATIFNDDGQIILYVLRPISESEEMVICYTVPYYSRFSRADRQNILKTKYEFECDCEACHFGWPETPYYGSTDMEHIRLCQISTDAILTVLGEYNDPFNVNPRDQTLRLIIPILCRTLKDLATLPTHWYFYQFIALICMLRHMMQIALCPPLQIAPEECGRTENPKVLLLLEYLENNEYQKSHDNENDERMSVNEGRGTDESMSNNQENYDQENDDQGNYDQENYEQGNYDQGNYEQENYELGNYELGNYEQGNCEQDGREYYYLRIDEQGNYHLIIDEQMNDDERNDERNDEKISDDQGNYDQGNYEQGNYDQGDNEQGNYEQGHSVEESDDQENYEQGNYNQRNYDQESDDQENYNQ